MRIVPHVARTHRTFGERRVCASCAALSACECECELVAQVTLTMTTKNIEAKQHVEVRHAAVALPARVGTTSAHALHSVGGRGEADL